MARLVIVSNRVPLPSERGPRAGGLAVALADALRPGTLWFGWSGKRSGTSEPEARQQRAEARPTPRSISPKRNTARSTSASPMARCGRCCISASAWWISAARTTKPIARSTAVRRLAGPAAARRRSGLGARLPSVPAGRGTAPARRAQPHRLLPAHAVRAAGAAARVAARGASCCGRCAPSTSSASTPRPIGARSSTACARSCRSPGSATARSCYEGRHVRVDCRSDRHRRRRLRRRPPRAPTHSVETARLRESLGGRALAIGVDRLDYSKGLVNRFEAFGRLLAKYPEHRRQVSFLQIAARSREESGSYQRLRRELDRIAGDTNGRFSEFDWVPLRYMTTHGAPADAGRLLPARPPRRW